MAQKSPAEKMLLRSGRTVRFVNAPPDLPDLLGQVPADTAAEGAPADIILLFAHHRADLEALLPPLRDGLAPGGMVWVAYHKGTSPVKTDINRDTIWKYAQTVGFDAVAQISISDDWSAMRLKVIERG